MEVVKVNERLREMKVQLESKERESNEIEKARKLAIE